jgi:hypothetical protein
MIKFARLLATADALKQLRASLVELQSQLKHQAAALAGAQKHTLELERIYEFLLNPSQLTSTDNEALRKQMIARLEKQRDLPMRRPRRSGLTSCRKPAMWTRAGHAP